MKARDLSSNADAASGDHAAASLDARALEYFDDEALHFLRERYPLVPLRAAGAVFFEQEITDESEEALMGEWLSLLEGHGALLDDSWFGTNEHDRAEMSAFRHQLPVMVNEWLARHGQRKVSTDMAVPDAHFAAMLGFYKETLRRARLKYVTFGHIGDNHVHVNIMPRDDIEQLAAREIYAEFIRRAVSFGGTISAEHGVGKIKREYLRALYGDEHLREMAELKRAFDPACDSRSRKHLRRKIPERWLSESARERIKLSREVRADEADHHRGLFAGRNPRTARRATRRSGVDG